MVIFDSDLASDDTLSFVATDNFHGGQLAGEHLGQAAGRQGQGASRCCAIRRDRPAPINASRAFSTRSQRSQRLKVVSDNQYGGATTESAFKASENLLAAQTDRGGRTLQGIFCPNESTAFGMLRALEDDAWPARSASSASTRSDKLVEALRRATWTRPSCRTRCAWATWR